jgi:hypothetical protein
MHIDSCKTRQIELFISERREYFLFVFYILDLLTNSLLTFPFFISFRETPPNFHIFFNMHLFSYVYKWNLKIGLIHVQVLCIPLDLRDAPCTEPPTYVNSTLRELETVSNSSVPRPNHTISIWSRPKTAAHNFDESTSHSDPTTMDISSFSNEIDLRNRWKDIPSCSAH